MKKEILASLIEEGSKIASDLIRVSMATRPGPSPSASASVPSSPASASPARPSAPSPSPASQEELSYRFECLGKHLGGASVLLREAYERANDEGVGEGTAEKVLEAMNEHSGAEADLEKMLPIPEANPIANKILSGVRAFRKAAWEAKLPTGGGTKQDIEDARVWNAIMLQDIIKAAKEHPGTACVAEGM